MTRRLVLVWALITIGVFVLSVWLFVQGSKQWYTVIGRLVNASECQILECQGSLTHGYACTYGGNVTIVFDLDDERYAAQASPNTDCDMDCCASIVEQQTPVYVETITPSHQIKTWSIYNDMNGVFTVLGVAMLFVSTGFCCCLTVVMCREMK